LRRALEGRDLARHDGEGEAQHRAEATGHAALFATQLSSRRSSFFFLSLGRRFVGLFFLRLTSLFPLLHLHSLAKQKTQNTMNLLLLGAVGLPVGYLAYGYAYLFVPPK
jgi:hypothetical protein